MTPQDAGQALRSIEDSLRAAEDRRDAATREIDALRAARESMRAALGEFELPPPRAPRKQTVAQYHVDAVREYLQAQREARQADIGKELSINSGIVSVALKRLHEEDGVVEPGIKDYGSRVWRYVEPPRNVDENKPRTRARSRK